MPPKLGRQNLPENYPDIFYLTTLSIVLGTAANIEHRE